jgi:hypothetical protein
LCCAIVLLVVSLQLAHKLDACVDILRLELEKVQSAADRVISRFTREVYKLCE